MSKEHFLKEAMQTAPRYIHHHSEVSPHICSDGYYQPPQEISVGKDLERGEPL